MTEENYRYRTSPLMLRNDFPGEGPWRIPIIPKAEFAENEFDDLLLIGFDRIKPEDGRHCGRMVHFFLYDYKFERVWNRPEWDEGKLGQYRAVLSPDFSMYLEMSPVMQLYNVFRNRWCGAYWASKGIRVIPTVSWGDESTFAFCFKGIPKGSTVAVSTYMVSEHGHHADQKDFFMKGYRELLRQVEPERIICYNEPFPEMEGNIVYVNYERSSWKYQGGEDIPSKYLPYIRGEKILPEGSGIVIKTGCVLRGESPRKGMGSVYGGAWKPAKPEDERLLGKPGEIKMSYTTKGELIETHIGPDEKADFEIHHTDHGQPKFHDNPHRHNITWDERGPHWGRDDFLEKQYRKGELVMSKVIGPNSFEENRFKSIGDFKDCMGRGGEVQFEWKGVDYCCFGRVCPGPGQKPRMVICQAGSVEVNSRTEMWGDTADELLEYMVGGDRLRDVITQVKVWERII